MHAMILDENRNFKWCEMPDPVRKPGEVIIEVHAAAARIMMFFMVKTFLYIIVVLRTYPGTLFWSVFKN